MTLRDITTIEHHAVDVEWMGGVYHVLRCSCGWFTSRHRLGDAAVAFERHQVKELRRELDVPAINSTRPFVAHNNKEAHCG